VYCQIESECITFTYPYKTNDVDKIKTLNSRYEDQSTGIENISLKSGNKKLTGSTRSFLLGFSCYFGIDTPAFSKEIIFSYVPPFQKENSCIS
jgi:hypothetical protein